jgi:hypothetical protein
MEQKQRSNNTEAFASTTSDDDARAEQEILQGLRDALNRKAKRRKVQLSPEMCDKLLEESFPKIHHPEEDKAKELTMDEYVALRTGLQEVIQSDVKEKMALLREQLSEYHSVLEDVMAFKSRCERLEQEKQDLLSLCREACQVRDDKIALLEKELARLRNEPRHRGSVSSSCSSTDGPFSATIGGGCESQHYLLGHTHPQEGFHHYIHPQEGYHHHIHPQEDYQHHPQPGSSDNYNGLSVGAIHPLLFQEPSAPIFLEMMNQQGVVADNYPYSPWSEENRNTKRRRPS